MKKQKSLSGIQTSHTPAGMNLILFHGFNPQFVQEIGVENTEND